MVAIYYLCGNNEKKLENFLGTLVQRIPPGVKNNVKPQVNYIVRQNYERRPRPSTRVQQAPATIEHCSNRGAPSRKGWQDKILYLKTAGWIYH
ncbi:hypothetical protein HPB49_004204 [Dermacentor silvarum]|uniref:Uncharacterized protein n=1 Tax=Dermacentor silvarum TaxID=543639 RepID=A0ACB8CV53_DERSI|nr:hypothetical protein HPB49_004204 [Dermacentor silvarum]